MALVGELNLMRTQVMSFPQNVLAAITLVGHGTGGRGATAGDVGQGQVSATRAEALRVGFLLSASLPPPPSRRPSAPKRARARAREAGNIIWFRSGYRV